VILTLTMGNGPWDQFGILYGLVILAVVAAYYRPVPVTVSGRIDAVAKAIAFAAVVALVGFILLAYPLQQFLIKPLNPPGQLEAEPPGACSELDLPAPRVTLTRAAYEACLGEITSSWAWLVCLVLFLVAVGAWSDAVSSVQARVSSVRVPGSAGPSAPRRTSPDSAAAPGAPPASR
jgi:hypothetical protein